MTHALVVALALLGSMAAHAGEVSTNGYTVRYAERTEAAPGDLHGATVGNIRIARASDQSLLWQEDTPLRPGCGAIPAATVLAPCAATWAVATTRQRPS